MDEKYLEMAEAFQQAEVEEAVAKILANTRKHDPTFNGACLECGESIPPARIAFGAETCHPCQVELERIQKSKR